MQAPPRWASHPGIQPPNLGLLSLQILPSVPLSAKNKAYVTEEMATSPRQPLSKGPVGFFSSPHSPDRPGHPASGWRTAQPHPHPAGVAAHPALLFSLSPDLSLHPARLLGPGGTPLPDKAQQQPAGTSGMERPPGEVGVGWRWAGVTPNLPSVSSQESRFSAASNQSFQPGPCPAGGPSPSTHLPSKPLLSPTVPLCVRNTDTLGANSRGDRESQWSVVRLTSRAVPLAAAPRPRGLRLELPAQPWGAAPGASLLLGSQE